MKLFRKIERKMILGKNRIELDNVTKLRSKKLQAISTSLNKSNIVIL